MQTLHSRLLLTYFVEPEFESVVFQIKLTIPNEKKGLTG